MLQKICSWLYLALGLIIGLGAFGHGSQAVHVHEALDGLPVPAHTAGVIFVVWYFASGCMLVLGAILVWSWFRVRKGETALLFVPNLIGAFYCATGILSLIAMHGEPFWWLFVAEGVLLLGAAQVLGKHPKRV